MRYRYKWKDNKWCLGDDYNETLSIFTGVKDNNNKDVYQNDIIKMMSGDKEFYYIIVWNKEKLAWCLNNGTLFSDIVNSGVHFEVVGNIFDNHELLNRILKYDGSKKE